MRATIESRSEKSAAVVRVNLLKLPRPPLERRACRRVGSPTNSGSYIPWVET
jgi:hypothetical protein